jgi:hypothetical protein
VNEDIEPHGLGSDLPGVHLEAHPAVDAIQRVAERAA